MFVSSYFSLPSGSDPLFTDAGPSEDDVRASLQKAHTEDAESATKTVYGTSASAFIVAGIQLEDIQYVSETFRLDSGH